MISIITASVSTIFLLMPHSSPSQSRPSVELQCTDQGTDLGVQKFTCYRHVENEKKVDESLDPNGWSCRFSFFENGTKGKRQKLYCKNTKTGEHKLVYGDFL
ncbi:hypothetical protein PP940_gp147 [Rhizobium phage RL2RES]|uniref:Uncharacterized protein n=1 Tax=Rhizobium phage RL2RES TaxID=103371 RepID=A0A6B9J1Y2_9CAUD|nr:hypothetical protein PP940_gp147 [Rhizobium phage RL2RES]QGZ14257.1 hypothetical protein RL2RES_147 [Rhizobium phage RL2RES]